ncbi:MAG TPA: metallophosphoesterase [Candidatus Binataceae bacterium]|nr:metallophosphoesterase [Candidatus Binataceae bacterium]
MTEALTASSRDVVVVHSSDIHVDTVAVERVFGADGTAGLGLVLATAQRIGADVVLLAGDTFEHNRLPLAVLDRAARLLEAARLPVVILPGNHDPAIPESAFHRGGIGDLANVHVLGITHEQAVLFPALGLEIWGHAHRDYGNMAPLRAPQPRRTRWQIAVAHGHYEPAPAPGAKLAPSWLISDEEIAATQADYVALGHWNRAARVGNGGIAAYYSGSPDLAATVNRVRFAADGSVVVTRETLVTPA